MSTVREATFELLRARGMTTIFGNPGSTELPMLADYPDDFRYVLGLQEAVVVGMADGYAQASGNVGHVNLHTAPGVGNAMGAIFNAQANHAPLLDHRRPAGPAGDDDAGEPDQPRRDADAAPARQVVLRGAAGRGRARRRSAARSTRPSLPPEGPGVRLDPDGRLDRRGRRRRRRARRSRAGSTAAPPPPPTASPSSPSGSPPRRTRSSSPGPTSTPPAAGTHAVALAESQHLPVWAIPATGGGRLGFPEGHANFRGVLPPAIGPVAETLAGHDLILVAGASVFAYYPYIPGDLLPEGAELVVVTSDPEEAARAPMGEAIVADVALTLERSPRRARRASPAAPAPEPARRADDRGRDGRRAGTPISGTEAMAALGAAFPGRRDRRPRGALVDPRAPQPAADLASRLLLLRRRRRARLRPLRSGRRADGPARPAGRLRRRRGLGPVRDHRVLERRRLRRPGHLPGPPQLRVRDPQVVLARRGRRERLPASTCRRSTSPRSPRATASLPRGSRRGDELEAALTRQIGSGKPGLVEVGVAPGMWLA